MRVLIGCPTYSLYAPLLDLYLRCVKTQDFKDYDLVLVDNSKDDAFFNEITKRGVTAIKGPYTESAKERVALSREILRKKCLDEGYDYFLSLEQDVMARPDTLSRLLAHRTPIVGAYYGDDTELTLRNRNTGELRTVKVNIPLIYLQTRPGFIKRANAKDIINKGLIQVGASGLGCMLIHRSVLEKVSFKVNPDSGFDDVLFCKEAKEAGYKIMVDGNIILTHLHRDWKKMGVKK